MISFPGFDPGENYRLKKMLGSGRWKTAFRGWAQGHPVDVALLCLNESPPKQIAVEAAAAFRVPAGDPFRKYLPTFHNVFLGRDGNVWILEELLERTLADESPLYEVGRFTKIARDLSRGLSCLHRNGLIHRDIKLDNCGLDHSGRAKIFDLGSVISDGESAPCTVLTRAPELFPITEKLADAKPVTTASDVWALGATLYALRVGSYPFARREDVVGRDFVNAQLAENKMSQEEANSLKTAADKRITERILRPNAEESINSAIHTHFGGKIAATLASMLAFNPIDRPCITEIEEQWSTIAKRSDSPTSSISVSQSTWPAMIRMLESVKLGEISVTPIQLNRVGLIMQSEPPSDTELKERIELLLDETHALVAARMQARRENMTNRVEK